MTDHVKELIGAIGRGNNDLAKVYDCLADECFVNQDYANFNYFVTRANALREECHRLVDDLAKIIEVERA